MDALRPVSVCLYLEPNLGGVYTMISLDVAGHLTEGRTPDEILRNVQEVPESLKEAWRELGMDMPPALRPTVGDRSQAIEMPFTA